MRMWMVNPLILCKKHLLGEHVETHMFIGTLSKNINVSGYINNNLFEPKSLYKRHQVLSLEMYRRNIEHTTPLTEKEINFSYLNNKELTAVIDRKRSLEDLVSRCPTCLSNAKRLKSININLLDSFYVESSVVCPNCGSNIDAYVRETGTFTCINCKKILKVKSMTVFKIEVKNEP